MPHPVVSRRDRTRAGERLVVMRTIELDRQTPARCHTVHR